MNNTLTLEVEDNFDGGFTAGAGLLTVTLNQLVGEKLLDRSAAELVRGRFITNGEEMLDKLGL